MFELAGMMHMTPARFDILYVIHEHCPLKLVTSVVGYEVQEATITRKLGLARQTVWQMVERLVQLGWLTRRKDPNFHARKNVVALTKEGLKAIREAMGAAFTERPVLPRAAPIDSDAPVPRYWRRPELADVALDKNGERLPTRKTGREVAKVFTSFAWRRIPGGKRGRRDRHLAFLDRMIEYAKSIARALGDTSVPIYKLDYEPDH